MVKHAISVMLKMGKNGEDAFRALVEKNAKTIGELQERVHRLLVSEKTHEGRVAWSAASEEFLARYDSLSFPGGFGEGLCRIQNGDAEAIDLALSFLELKPYFFRSQYMRTKLIRVLKHAVLSEPQSQRFQRIRNVQTKAGRRPVSS